MSPEVLLVFAARALELALGVFGPAIARKKIDEWEAAEKAAEALAETRLGPRP